MVHKRDIGGNVSSANKRGSQRCNEAVFCRAFSIREEDLSVVFSKNDVIFSVIWNQRFLLSLVENSEVFAHREFIR